MELASREGHVFAGRIDCAVGEAFIAWMNHVEKRKVEPATLVVGLTGGCLFGAGIDAEQRILTLILFKEPAPEKKVEVIAKAYTFDRPPDRSDLKKIIDADMGDGTADALFLYFGGTVRPKPSEYPVMGPIFRHIRASQEEEERKRINGNN